MTLPGEQVAQEYVAAHFQSELEKNELLLNFAISILPDGGKLPTDIPFNVRLVVLGLHSKAIKTFRAISILAERGLGSDAICLLRVLLETQFVLRYILAADTEARVSRYLAFTCIVQGKKIGDTFELPPEQTAEAEVLAKEVKEKHGDKWWELAEYGKWDGKSIFKMAKEIGLEDLYSKVYALACQPTHAGDVTEHIGVKPDLNFEVKVCPSEDWVDSVLAMSRETFGQIELAVSSALRLGQEKQITDLLARGNQSSAATDEAGSKQ